MTHTTLSTWKTLMEQCPILALAFRASMTTWMWGISKGQLPSSSTGTLVSIQRKGRWILTKMSLSTALTIRLTKGITNKFICLRRNTPPPFIKCLTCKLVEDPIRWFSRTPLRMRCLRENPAPRCTSPQASLTFKKKSSKFIQKKMILARVEGRSNQIQTKWRTKCTRGTCSLMSIGLSMQTSGMPPRMSRSLNYLLKMS